jgi:uncharacterized protein
MSGPGTTRPPSGRRQARDLDSAEIDAVIRSMRVAVLATSADDVPYAVPVIYGYDGSDFFVAMRDGRKADNLDRNPAVCLTIADVEDAGVRWRSVVVAGSARWVRGINARLHALDTLRRQHEDRFAAHPRDVARLAGARVLRISPESVTGRGVGV